MTTYVVTSKATGLEVYRYVADAPVEWVGMEFATHAHDEQAEEPTKKPAPATSGHTMTKLAYLRLFSQAERIAIRAAALQNTALDDYLRMLELAEEVDTTDADTVAAVRMLEALGLLGAGRADEILGVL